MLSPPVQSLGSGSMDHSEGSPFRAATPLPAILPQEPSKVPGVVGVQITGFRPLLSGSNPEGAMLWPVVVTRQPLVPLPQPGSVTFTEFKLIGVPSSRWIMPARRAGVG